MTISSRMHVIIKWPVTTLIPATGGLTPSHMVLSSQAQAHLVRAPAGVVPLSGRGRGPV